MEYYYGIMWLIVAFLLIFRLSKESKIFYVLGSYFTLLGVLWIADGYFDQLDIVNSVYGDIIKLIGGVCLVVALGYMYILRKKRKN